MKPFQFIFDLKIKDTKLFLLTSIKPLCKNMTHLDLL